MLDFGLTEEQQAVRDLAKTIADEEIRPIAAEHDVTGEFPWKVIKKMAEVGESVAPIPPGVIISIASGAIVALADLATLEVEADVAEANVAKVENGQPA